jgi:CheY-like chemotaxis protein
MALTLRNMPSPDMQRVLIADDNSDAAESFGEILEIMGYQTRVVTDGLRALNVAAEFQPHAALLDLGMPGLSGYDLARELRATPWGRSMLLIAVTGWGSVEDRRRSQVAGFNHHFVKPVDPMRIEAVLEEASASSQR